MTHPVPPTPTPPPWPGGPCYDDPAAYLSRTAVEVRRVDGTVVVAHEPAEPAMDQTAEEAIVAYLREAARLMRERANAATPGPWQRYGMTGVAATDGDVVGEQPIVCEDCGWRVAVTGCATDADAEHIASWHPAVALAIADWLDEAADSLERLIPAWTAPPAGVDCPPGVAWRRPKLLAALIEGYYGRALAVARAYMGVAR